MTIDKFQDVTSLIANHIHCGSLEAALQSLIAYATALSQDKSLTGKLFSSQRLDELAQQIGNRAFQHCHAEFLLGATANATQPDSVVYLATHVASFGGHARVIEDCIKAQPGKRNIVVLTDLFRQRAVTAERKQAYEHHGAEVVYAPDKSNLEKLLWLQQWLAENRPETVFLFNHHQDAIAIAAALSRFPSRFVYYHHADHNLALGVHVEHFLHIDLAAFGYWNCRKNLGIENVYLPLTIEDLGCVKQQQTFSLSGKLRTCTSGTQNKFDSPYEHSYFAMLPDIISSGDGTHIHIGPLTDDKLAEIYRGLEEHGIELDRFMHIPWVDSLWQALIDNEIDVYLTSFPIGGGRASIEAMGAGIPIVFHDNSNSIALGGAFIGHANAPAWKKPKELYNILRQLTQEQLQQQSRLAREHYEQYYDFRHFQQALSFLPETIGGIDALAMKSLPPATDLVTLNGQGMCNTYRSWIDKKALRDIDLQIFDERATQWAYQPTFHCILYLDASEQHLLADTIDSLSRQLYQSWRLSVLSALPCPDPIFDKLDILKWVQIGENDAIDNIANDLLDAVRANWILWLTPGVVLEPNLLNVCADYVNVHPEWRLIYTDEDIITLKGDRQEPQFKPDFNLDLLRSMPYIGNAVLVQRDALLEVGGYDNVDAAIVNFATTLKITDLYGESSIGHIADMLFHQSAKKPIDIRVLETQGPQILQAHLARNGIDANVQVGLLPGSFFIDYPLTNHPLVSIIVPTRDRLDLVKPCVDSVLAKTSYDNFEVIIMDNNSIEPETLAYFEFLEAHDKRVRVIKYPHPYNFSAINNEAARQAQGEYLVLLNNDTVVIQDNWFERMLAHGLRPEVGVVGCRLVFPNQRLQHAGVILGMNGTADHLHIDQPMNVSGYMNRAQVVQNFSAVTAACLLVKKSIYFQVDGLDEEKFEVLFNDVDFCLKVGELGHKIVWTPYATLVHHGSSSLKRVQDPKTIARYRRADTALLEKWLPKLANDPAYNRHLSLSHRDCRIEVEASATWDNNFRDRFRVLAVPFNSFGTGEYRVRAPMRALENAGLAQCALLPGNDEAMRLPEIVELERIKPDALLLQNADHDLHLNALERYEKFANHVFRVFGQDDLVFQVPQKNPFRQVAPKDLKLRIRKALSLCDRLIVATEPMAEALRGMIDDIHIVPNYLEDSLWQGLTSQRRVGRKPRVGWAGGEQHQGDLELILPLVKATAQEFDWVFFGMCPEVLRPHVKEIHNGVPFLEYPAKLASLNLDVAVAPLEHNRFNVAKSNLRLLEYGIMGWPTICSDIEPYRNGNAPVVRVPNNPNAWIKAVREYAYDLDAAAVEGDKLTKWVLDNWMLSDHAEEWLQALMPH